MTDVEISPRRLLRTEKIAIRKIRGLGGAPDCLTGQRYVSRCGRCSWSLRTPDLTSAWRLSKGHIGKRHTEARTARHVRRAA